MKATPEMVEKIDELNFTDQSLLPYLSRLHFSSIHTEDPWAY
jgi:hypothetical protein